MIQEDSSDALMSVYNYCVLALGCIQYISVVVICGVRVALCFIRPCTSSSKSSLFKKLYPFFNRVAKHPA